MNRVRVAYEDWPSEFQELWDELDQTVDFSEMTVSQIEYAEFMFEEGFMHYSGEVAYADMAFAREEFWDLIGEEFEDIFDWEGWREAMGYD